MRGATWTRRRKPCGWRRRRWPTWPTRSRRTRGKPSELERALAAAAAGTLPADLEALRKLPAAILEWAQRRLGLVPHLAVGQELEIPPDRLSAFALEGTLPPRGSLVRVRVLSPGWKRGPRMLVPPRVMIV